MSPPSDSFKGFARGQGGFRRGHRPDTCGNPTTGNVACPALALLEDREPGACQVCHLPARPGRTLCNRHRILLSRYGNAEATGHFNTKWIASDAAGALRLMKAIRKLPADHPARVQLAHAVLWVQCQLEHNRGIDLRGYRPGMTSTLRVRRRWGNLASAGVTPERIIAMVTGFYTARDTFEAAFLSDRHWYHQIGRSVATLAALPTTVTPPFKDEDLWGLVVVPLGERLVQHIGTFAGSLAIVLQTGKPFSAIPALTAGLPPPSKAACVKAVERKNWRPRE